MDKYYKQRIFSHFVQALVMAGKARNRALGRHVAKKNWKIKIDVFQSVFIGTLLLHGRRNRKKALDFRAERLFGKCWTRLKALAEARMAFQ